MSAVSKVLRDAYGVSPHMRETVQRAIDSLGYRPQAGARAMRGRSYTIGVLMPDVHSPFAPLIVDGILKELEGSPFEVMLGPGGSSSAKQRSSVEAMVDRQMDGLVLIAPVMASTWLEDLAATLPVVSIARHGKARNFDTVVDDDEAGAHLMVDHLVRLGHRDIAHISSPQGELRRPARLSHTARADGFVAAMQQHGLRPDVVIGNYTEQGGYRAARQALSRAHLPTAIFAGADTAAIGALRAADEFGLRVPEDLTVTGYDNTDLSSIPQVSLTSVDQSGELTGSTSARFLLERLAGRTSPVAFSVTPRLVVRRSSAPPARR
ncbi:LacI family DNA-binding transcriptional regulator [Acidothermaceae bacterium B102]|nr:LacI family DNA-binding transcriptional regulator [Acidothermaceae bacterium B102]